ncbi:MAG: 5-formyltetrahydrofolate cyclo-ligase [Betaproteobacteria bacterium]|nr:MAG: 5-formyltetrahydrofolate cyclo-ligase [Betaproteobacteria bacterium]
MLSSSDPAQSANEDMREAKRSIRARVLRVRDAMPADLRASASGAIVAALAARDDFASATTLLLTLPFGSEWDTRPLIEAALERGKRVALPRVNAGSRMLDLCAVTDVASDAANGFRGIPEPGMHCELLPVGAIDWVLVPGVAFDVEGRRIGYGGGYYDRLLALLSSNVRRVAGAFEVQVVDRVPAAEHDLAIEALVTESRSLTIPR